MKKDAKQRLNEISEDLMDILDRLEELSEDEETISEQINEAIDKLSDACEIVDALAE